MSTLPPDKLLQVCKALLRVHMDFVTRQSRAAIALTGGDPNEYNETCEIDLGIPIAMLQEIADNKVINVEMGFAHQGEVQTVENTFLKIKATKVKSDNRIISPKGAIQ